MSGQPEQPEERPEDDVEREIEPDAELDTGLDTGAAKIDADKTETDEDPLAVAEARADENWNRYLRAAAETENVRKRAVRDLENARKFALESFGRDVLAVKDSLEMGIQAGETADAETLLSGKEATLKILATVLERFGIAEVDPEGEPFDPEFHEAMTLQPSDDAEPGSVLTVIQKGYSLNGRLLRPAMVVVAAEPAEKD